MQMRSSNPMLNVDRIVDIGRKAGLTGVSETLSVRGTAGKFGILAGLCMISAFGTVAMHLPYAVAMVGLLVATICYFAACFVPRLAPALSVVYAVGEGMCLGLISAFAESRYPGVVMVALAATLSVCVAMFLAFATGFISATQKLKAFLSIASLGLLITYVVALLVNIFTGNNFLTTSDHSVLSFAISIFAVVVSSFFLIWDFDNVLQAEGQADKKMEWFFGMGLLATVVWMYVEILKLLLKIYSSSNE